MATLDIVLADLTELQRELAGEGAPAQASRDTLGRSFAALLEPRQRETLASSLLTFIARVTEARNAANAAGAGQAEAEAAQTAADEALQALRLVVAADTAARAGGGEAAQTAAINALNAIDEVDAAAPDATTRINAALEAAVRAAEAEVARLEAALAAARTPGGDPVDVSGLQRQLAEAQSRLDELTPEFGSSPAGPSVRTASTTYHARRTGATIWFDATFEATGPWGLATDYTLVNRGTAPADGFDLTPDAVLYNPAGSNPRVFTATSPNTSHFPGRGKVYRGELRHLLDGDANANNNDNSRDWIYGVADRLVEQGVNAEACSGANDPAVGTTCPDVGGLTSGKQGSGGTPSSNTNLAVWDNFDAPASMTFQYKSGGGFTMGFGGEGVIFGDLERYAAKGGRTNACGTGGTPAYCDESTTANVELSFGAPQADPYGQPDTHYWNVQVPSPKLPGSAAADSAANAVAIDVTRPGNQVAGHDAGRYELLLSNYAGASRRLAYAAYGLFNFVDFSTTNDRIGRMQIFHYGLDAFADRDGRRPTDLTASNTIEGTFRGHTAAWIVTSISKTENLDRAASIQNLFRTRGDLEMRACIGAAGTSCTIQNFADTPSALAVNTITGRITNLEYVFQNRPGAHWTTSRDGGIAGAAVLGEDSRAAVTLEPATIEAAGTYSGDVGYAWIQGARPGTYEGAFYGPAGAGLETAGTWRLNSAAWESNDWDAIIGSFGAVCEGTCRPASSP